jgi:hypothetical protein
MARSRLAPLSGSWLGDLAEFGGLAIGLTVAGSWLWTESVVYAILSSVAAVVAVWVTMQLYRLARRSDKRHPPPP